MVDRPRDARYGPWRLLVFRSPCHPLPSNVGGAQDWLLTRRILSQSGGTEWWTEEFWVGRGHSCPKRKKAGDQQGGELHPKLSDRPSH